MTTTEWITVLSSISALVVSGVALYRSLKTLPKDLQISDADAAEKYAKVSGLTADQNFKLSQRVQELEREVESLKQKQDSDQRLLREWARGIDLLIHQVASHSLTPVWTPRPYPPSLDLPRPPE